MKYFKARIPYLGMIAANSIKEADRLYCDEICDVDEDPSCRHEFDLEEISEDAARKMWADADDTAELPEFSQASVTPCVMLFDSILT
jgi:hypothetical protein